MPLKKLSIRGIVSRPLRSLLTLMSIIIGVAAIVATSLASNSAQLAQIAMVKAVTGNASLEIEAVAGASFGSEVLEQVKGLPGVSVASPVLRRYSNLSIPSQEAVALPESNHNSEESGNVHSENGNAKPKVSTRFRVQLLGVLPALDRQVRGYEVVAGEPLSEEPDPAERKLASVLMDEGFAKSAKLAVGTEVQFLTRDGLKRAIVRGLIKPSDASAGLQSGLIIAHLPIVQRWSKAMNKLDAIQLVLAKEAKTNRVRTSVEAVLPEGIAVREPTLRSQLAGESTVAMQQGLRLATAFSLLISAFIIYNTFQMNVGERRRQLGILRSMGATQKQLMLMILREGIWLGVVGAILGCVVGHFGASILRQSTAQLLKIEIPPSPFSVWPYLVAVLCGLLVAGFGSFFPAYRASRLSPAEAMRVVSSGEFGTSRKMWLIIGGAFISIGLILQVLSISRTIDIQHSIFGAVLMKMGIVFLLPGIISDLTAFVAWMLSGFIRTESKLARRQLLRHRPRTSLTIGTVFIAMGTGLGMASTILDNIRNVEGWYQRAIVGDFFVRAAMPDMNSGQSADMPDGLTEKVTAMPGVDLVDTLRFVKARSNETSVIVVVRHFNSESQDYFDLVEGKEDEVLREVREGQVVLGSVLSQRLNLHVGDKIPLETNEGSTVLKVAGVTNEYIAGGLTLYLESGHAKRLLNVDGTDVIVVRAKKSQLRDVETQLRALCDETGLMFQSYADLVTVIRTTLNGVVGGLWAVLALGSIIAAFGLINTLAMNILEQTREIGMLRVVAMTRWQIRKMILSQAMIMGIIGIVPGVLTGIWISYVINLTTMPVTGHDIKFQLYPWLILGALLFELAIVLIAAMIPAERAARLNLSSALQYE